MSNHQAHHLAAALVYSALQPAAARTLQYRATLPAVHILHGSLFYATSLFNADFCVHFHCKISHSQHNVLCLSVIHGRIKPTVSLLQCHHHS